MVGKGKTKVHILEAKDNVNLVKNKKYVMFLPHTKFDGHRIVIV